MLLLVMASSLSADLIKENYITLDINGSNSVITVDFESDNLVKFIKLDDSGNGIVSWREIKRHRGEIESLVLDHLSIMAGESECKKRVDGFEVYRRIHQTYIKLHIGLDCTPGASKIKLRYDLFFDVDREQKAFVKVSERNFSKPAVLSGRKTETEIELKEGSFYSSFRDFLIEGVWHIWIGFDHILFLLMLILPSVYSFKGGVISARSGFKEIFKEVLKVVTAFSAAHSVTLGLSSASIVHIEGSVVEVAIALSILLTALNNLLRFTSVKGWITAFAFGLVHGFGFANVLKELIESGSGSFSAILLGFNLGVEAGQLAIVALVLPVIYFLRSTLFYRYGVYYLLSAAAAVLSTVWALERGAALPLFTS